MHESKEINQNIHDLAQKENLPSKNNSRRNVLQLGIRQECFDNTT